ncbi:hypothetical protein D9758_010029 [Tetrapyrgos nigripes]|uniref:AB hydrolase-1 domain-containing protein n=1 Tax=Tetrapyrgos nigripes TaxID=182062 RepID=A0A8H5FT06_9AGAR|nr:hypothetical protein D9758_010029 [Tetrapyrgos nigripes]
MPSSFHPRPLTIPSPPSAPQYAFPDASEILFSCYPHPVTSVLHLPQLPTPQRKPIWASDERIPYTLTTHIVPAAYWREEPDTGLPQAPSRSDDLTKEERMKLVRITEQKLRQLRQEANEEKAKLNGKIGAGRHQEVLWLCLNRYVRMSPVEGGHTLFFAHANGFHKESWEPTLVSLLSSPQSQSQIREIWVWDAVNHGDSAILNQGKFDSLFHWRNAVLDLLSFLLYYIPDPAHLTTEPFPTHVPRLPVKETARRLQEGLLEGIIGVGHSFGGCVCTLSAISHPTLFHSLILIDPAIFYPNPDALQHPKTLAVGALARRGVWKDRDTARQGFLKSPFFQAWDPRVLDLYVETALCDDIDVSADTVVRLKTPPIQEANTFINSSTGSAEAWVRLWRGELQERVPLRWIVPGEGQKELVDTTPTSDGVTATQVRVWLRPSNSSNVRMAGAGHLMPQERPMKLGVELQQTLLRLVDGAQENVAKL